MEKNLIRIDDLPNEIQEKIREHQEEQRQLELRKRFDEIMQERQPHNIIINNHNTYYITNNVRILRNEGIINEKDEPAIDIIFKNIGRAAGKTAAWLKERNR